MTLREVFLWYCKDKKVFGNVISLYEQLIKPRQWSYKLGQMTRISFEEFLNREFSMMGGNNFFQNLFRCNIYPTTADNYDKLDKYNSLQNFKNACKKWRYFFKNNIKVKPIIKVNDEVVYDSFGIEYNGKSLTPVYCNSYGFFVVDIMNENGYKKVVRANKIKKINGTPFKLDFYIERRGKKYGFNKR